MESITMTISKDSWTQTDIGTIIGAMMPVLASKEALMKTIEVNNSTEIKVFAEGVEFTYVKLGELKSLVDTYCNTNGITIKEFNWAG